jgi:hypothetical protein
MDEADEKTPNAREDKRLFNAQRAITYDPSVSTRPQSA